MHNFYNLLKAILSGFFTGLAISIPLGPAGIESVKQTVSKGYRKGISVSLGALTADLTYFILINMGLANLVSKNKRTEALFWIISGVILSIIGYYSVRHKATEETEDKPLRFSNLDSFPFVTGFLITFSNPMTPSLWLTLSGTVIRAWYYVNTLCYYTFLLFLAAGMVIWFILLNLFALKGLKLLNLDKSHKTSLFLKLIILFIGIGFIIFGFVKLF